MEGFNFCLFSYLRKDSTTSFRMRCVIYSAGICDELIIFTYTIANVYNSSNPLSTGVPMTVEQFTTILTNILTSGGVAIFMYFLVRSLRQEIKSLNQTIQAQKVTLEAMEKQVTETEKIGEIYKNFMKDIPEHIDQYKTVITKTKDETIAVLQRANQEKDEQLKTKAQADLKNLESQEQALNEIPQLKQTLEQTLLALTKRVETVYLFDRKFDIDNLYDPNFGGIKDWLNNNYKLQKEDNKTLLKSIFYNYLNDNLSNRIKLVESKEENVNSENDKQDSNQKDDDKNKE
jgi:hypothetical protein